MKVGSVWSVKSSGRVEFARPGGGTAVVQPVDGRADFVLTEAGEFSALVDGKTITVKAS